MLEALLMYTAAPPHVLGPGALAPKPGRSLARPLPDLRHRNLWLHHARNEKRVAPDKATTGVCRAETLRWHDAFFNTFWRSSMQVGQDALSMPLGEQKREQPGSLLRIEWQNPHRPEVPTS